MTRHYLKVVYWSVKNVLVSVSPRDLPWVFISEADIERVKSKGLPTPVLAGVEVVEDSTRLNSH